MREKRDEGFVFTFPLGGKIQNNPRPSGEGRSSTVYVFVLRHGVRAL